MTSMSWPSSNVSVVMPIPMAASHPLRNSATELAVGESAMTMWRSTMSSPPPGISLMPLPSVSR